MDKPTEDLPVNTEKKITRREKKKKPKMVISGKSVFQLKKNIYKN